jgi:hypothetical protein
MTHYKLKQSLALFILTKTMIANASATTLFLSEIILNVEMLSDVGVINGIGAPVSKGELCKLWGQEFLHEKGPWGLGFASHTECNPSSKPGTWALRFQDTGKDIVRISLLRKMSDKTEIVETQLETPARHWKFGGADSRYIRLVTAAILEDSPIVAQCSEGQLQNCGSASEKGEFFSFAPKYPGTFEPFAIEVDALSGALIPHPPRKSATQWMVTTSERAKNRLRFLDATAKSVKQMQDELESRSLWKPQVAREPVRESWLKATRPRGWFDFTQSVVAFDSKALRSASNGYFGGDIEVVKNFRMGPELRTRSFSFDVNTRVRFIDREVTDTVTVSREENAVGAHAEYKIEPIRNISIGVNGSIAGSYGKLQISTTGGLPRAIFPENYRTWGLSSNLGANVFWRVSPFFSIGPYMEANYLKTPNTWSLGADIRGHIGFQTLSRLGEDGVLVEGISLLGVGVLDENLKSKSSEHNFVLTLGATYLRAGVGLSVRLP